MGLIEFEFEGDPVLLEVHVFQTRTFSGEMTETEEMRPQWWEEAEVGVTTVELSLVNNSYSPVRCRTPRCGWMTRSGTRTCSEGRGSRRSSSSKATRKYSATSYPWSLVSSKVVEGIKVSEDRTRTE